MQSWLSGFRFQGSTGMRLTLDFRALRIIPAALLLAAPWPAPPAAAVPISVIGEVSTDDARLHRAVALIGEGRLDEAQALALEVLEANPDLAPAHEINGMILAKQGDIDAAIAAFKKAVAINPGQASAYTKLGDVYLALGETATARGYFEQALTLNPRDRHAHQRMGLILRSEGDIPGAIAELEKGLLGTSAGYLGVKVDLALLYNLTGQHERSAALLAPFGKDREHNPLVHRVLANAALGLERFAQAVKSYKVALALDPGDVQARTGLGIALRGDGDLEGAVKTHEQAAQQAPDNPLVVLELARSRHAAGQTEAAIAGLQAALPGIKSNPEALETALAELYLAAGQPDRAEALYRAQIDEGRAPPAAYGNLGTLQQRAGDLAGAEASYKAMIAAFPQAAEPQFRLGSLYGFQQRYEDAIEAYGQGLKIEPGNPALLKGAAWAHQQLGQSAQAISFAERMANRLEAGAADHFFLATLLQANDQPDAAAERYRQAIALAPDYWPALNNLAVILTDRGDLDEALKTAQRVVELAPDNAAATDTLGWAQFRAGDAKKAAATLVEAVRQDPEGAIYHFHLAQVQAGLGQTSAARKSAEIALELAPDAADAPEIREFLEAL
jgi:tetratricopeptide (TPR) repeat protein